jgi:uncharacterized protein YjiK
VLVRGPVRLDKVEGDASGIAFNPHTKSLFVALNSPPAVVEVGLDGTTIRRIQLQGFDDTEGIVYVGNGTFAVTEERIRMANLIRIDRDTKRVSVKDAKRTLVDPEDSGNNGLEGIAWDPLKDVYYGVKERSPRKVYRFRFPAKSGEEAKVAHPWDAEAVSLGMIDLAGIHYEPITRKLLIVSDESACVVECKIDGTGVSRLSLAEGSAGLKRRVPKPEGVTMDDAGLLYVISEPNLLYVFARK